MSIYDFTRKVAHRNNTGIYKIFDQSIVTVKRLPLHVGFADGAAAGYGLFESLPSSINLLREALALFFRQTGAIHPGTLIFTSGEHFHLQAAAVVKSGAVYHRQNDTD